MARPLWTGALQFGLVNVPIKLFPAVSEKRVRFHLVHDADGARIQEKRVCSKDGKEVPYAHVHRGFEIAKGKLVVLKPQELEQVAAKASRACEIEEFVDLASIDPVFFNATYYAVPDRHAEKAYRLLMEAMHKAGKVGIARLVLRTKESLAAVRATDAGLVVTTLHYADEVRSHKELDGMPARSSARSFPSRELAMADQLIHSLERDFEPKRYHDTYRDRVMELVEEKAEGKEIVTQPESAEPAQVVDLMEALKQSLASGRKSGPARAQRRRQAEPARRARRRHG